MAPPLRKASTNSLPRFGRTTLLKLALLIASVLAFLQLSGFIADALDLHGLSRGWPFVIVLMSGYLAAAAWRALRKRKKAIDHARWQAGLPNGFRKRLEEARKEACRWQGRK